MKKFRRKHFEKNISQATDKFGAGVLVSVAKAPGGIGEHRCVSFGAVGIRVAMERRIIKGRRLCE